MHLSRAFSTARSGRARTLLCLLAAGVASVALVACDAANANGDTRAGTPAASTPDASGPTGTPDASTPDAPTPDGGSGPGSSSGGGTGGSTPVATAPIPGGGNRPDSLSPSGPPSGILSPTGTPPPVGYPTQLAPAPIESVDILVRESFPPQYAAVVVSGLPSGCAYFHSISMERAGTTFEITVLNQVPADGAQVACTMIYGMVENTVELGSDLVSGTTYTVIVNGEERATFTAQ